MRKKRFDCVKMKWEIQKRIQEETKGMTSEEIRAMMEKRIQEDPILGPFVRRIRCINQADMDK